MHTRTGIRADPGQSGVIKHAVSIGTFAISILPPLLRHLHGDILRSVLAFVEEALDIVALACTHKRLTTETMNLALWPSHLPSVNARTWTCLLESAAHPHLRRAYHLTWRSAIFHTYADEGESQLLAAAAASVALADEEATEAEAGPPVEVRTYEPFLAFTQLVSLRFNPYCIAPDQASDEDIIRPTMEAFFNQRCQHVTHLTLDLDAYEASLFAERIDSFLPSSLPSLAYLRCVCAADVLPEDVAVVAAHLTPRILPATREIVFETAIVGTTQARDDYAVLLENVLHDLPVVREDLRKRFAQTQADTISVQKAPAAPSAIDAFGAQGGVRIRMIERMGFHLSLCPRRDLRTFLDGSLDRFDVLEVSAIELDTSGTSPQSLFVADLEAFRRRVEQLRQRQWARTRMPLHAQVRRSAKEFEAM